MHWRTGSALLALALAPLTAAHAQAVSNQESVRNGGFEYATTAPAGYASGWHSSASYARVEEAADPQGGRALRLDADAAELAFVHQELFLPEQIQSATLSLRLRVINRSDAQPPQPGSQINGVVGFVPYASGDQLDLNQSVLSGFLLQAAATGPGNWVEVDIPLDAPSIGLLNTARGQNQRLALYFQPAANNDRQSLLLDNVSFKVSGSYTPIGQSGSIAYVDGNALRRIKPDGSAAQTLWTHPGNAPELAQPRWRPDAAEIAFISDHEMAYSPFLSDLYGINPDGSGLRRISNAPSQQAVASGAFPNRGTVRLTITNNYSHFSGDVISTFFVLVRGSDLLTVNLPPAGQSTTVTIPDVARVVDGPQPIIFFYSSNRCGLNRRDLGGQVSVVAGSTVDLSVGFNAVSCASQFQPYVLELAWKRDGNALGYTVTNAPFLVPVAGSTGAGSSWWDTGGLIGALSWSPQDDRLLHIMTPGASNLYVREPSSGGAPQQLIADAILATPDDPAWLPDASAFLYVAGADLFQAAANGSNPQRLSVAARGETHQRPSPSPDGSWLVFERRLRNHGGSDASSLWLMRRDQPASMRPLASGSWPDWSRSSPALPREIFSNGFER
jgi:Tol biopolymer transport system component